MIVTNEKFTCSKGQLFHFSISNYLKIPTAANDRFGQYSVILVSHVRILAINWLALDNKNHIYVFSMSKWRKKNYLILPWQIHRFLSPFGVEFSTKTSF